MREAIEAGGLGVFVENQAAKLRRDQPVDDARDFVHVRLAGVFGQDLETVIIERNAGVFADKRIGVGFVEVFEPASRLVTPVIDVKKRDRFPEKNSCGRFGSSRI